MTDIHGVCPIVATPFTESDAVDLESLRSLVATLSEEACEAVTLFGVYGEFYKLSDDEKRSMVDVAADQLDGDATQLVVSVTEDATTTAVEHASAAEAAGADCLMVLPPSMLDPSPETQFDYVRAIDRAVDIPLILQYRPEMTGGASIAQLVDLVETADGVRYLKVESTPAGPTITRLLRESARDVGVLEGFAGVHMIEALDRGACGVMPGSAFVGLYRRIYDAYRRGDRERARDLHNVFVPLLNHLRQSAPMLLHYEKRVLVDRGIIETARCRQPAYAPDEYADRLFDELRDRIEI